MRLAVTASVTAAAVVVALGFTTALPLSAQSSDVQACAALKHHGDAGANFCYQRLTRSADPAVQAEGFWALGDFKNANDAFRTAVKARPKDANVRVRWGRMYLEHYQAPDAADLFNEALGLNPACAAAVVEKAAPGAIAAPNLPSGPPTKGPADAANVTLPKECAPALLGLALVAGENFEGQAIKLAELALKADPKLAEAHELMARVTLEDNDPKKSAEAANKALELDKESLDAMAVLATIDELADKKDTPWFPRILAINKKYGNAYAIAAHFFIINRRYEEGIEMYRKALELDPTLAGRAQRHGRKSDAPGQGRRSAPAIGAMLQRGLSEPGDGELPAAAG